MSYHDRTAEQKESHANQSVGPNHPKAKAQGKSEPTRIGAGLYETSGNQGQILRNGQPFLQVDLAGVTTVAERDAATRIIVRLFNESQKSEKPPQPATPPPAKPPSGPTTTSSFSSPFKWGK